MSRYVILIILTFPIIIAGIINVIVEYKLKKYSSKKLIIRETFWVGSLLMILFLEEIYNYLVSKGLTDSDPLSLFDVIMITAILLLMLVATRAHGKISHLEDRLNLLHRQLSIDSAKHTKKK